MFMGVKVVYRLFNGVVRMISGLGDDGESCSRVVVVRAVGVEVPEVILQQQLVLGQSLYRLQEIVGHFRLRHWGKFSNSCKVKNQNPETFFQNSFLYLY